MKSAAWLDALIKDGRYALRVMQRNAVVTSAVIATLALGIGANSAIFSVVDGVLLRPLPYPESDRIVTLQPIGRVTGRRNDATDQKRYLFWREHQQAFSSIAAFRKASPVTVEAGQESERVLHSAVTADFFDVLQVKPVIGRFFGPGDDQAGSAGAAVLDYGFWQRRFGGDTGILGRNIRVGSRAYSVIGVAPAGMVSMLAADLWIPLVVANDPLARGTNYRVLARLRKDVTVSGARAGMEVIADQYRAAFGNSLFPDEGVGVFRYQDEAVRDNRPALLVLSLAVALVLLIACANVANLLLARAVTRRREIAVRLAIGASRSQLLRQLLIEGLLFALAGGLLSLVITRAAISAIVQYGPEDLPRLNEITLDWRVLLFTLAVAVLTGLLSGIAPALQSVRCDVRESLQESSGRTGDSGAGRRVRSVLVVLEFTVSFILLVETLLLVQTFVRLRLTNPGFDSSHVLTMQMTLNGSRYQTSAQASRFAEQATARVKLLPGVHHAAVTNYLPMSGGFNVPLGDVTGQARRESQFLGTLQWFGVTPDFFRTMSIPVRRGREFNDRDTGTSPPVVIVNEAFATAYLNGRDPLGNRIVIAWAAVGERYADAPREIVGVANDIREKSLAAESRPAVFVPLGQVSDAVSGLVNQFFALNLVVRTAGDPSGLSRRVTEEIRAVEPMMPISNVRSMDEVLSDSLEDPRFLMLLIGTFGALAVLLAGIGIYGVGSYSVSQRRREIGIRAALGARPGILLAFLLREGMLMIAVGVTLGSIGSWMLTQMLTGLLYGVGPRDPVTFGAAAAMLAGFALLACVIPARHVLRIEPIEAFR
jgi:putative ABC transport system permease protein